MCVSGQMQSAFICLRTSAYVLLNWTLQLPYKNRSYGRPAGAFSLCATMEVDVIFGSKISIPYTI